MTDILIVPPSCEPLSLAVAKANLKEPTTGQDALINDILRGARMEAERMLTRALVLQSRQLRLKCFPGCGIDIAWGPVRAVQSVQYLDSAGALQTLAANQYRVDKLANPARIVPEYSITWPSTYAVDDATVRVNYTAGILLPFTVSAGTDVLTCAGHGYADGDVTQVQTIGGAIPVASGLTAGLNVYVRDATADTLKLALTSGGAALDFTDAGTAPNVLGVLDKQIERGLQLLIQYQEQRDGNAEILKAAERVLEPLAVWRA